MATYKVIQDIESEDKLLGPLTLRQFVYAVLVVVMAFIAFKLGAVSPLFIVPFILPIIFFGLLAAPFGHDQSSEVWLLAKIGFFLRPRRRIWDQSGIQQLVTITVPKHVEKHLTDGLTQSEVKSRLQALANTIDSRGWAVKNVTVNLSALPSDSEDTYTSDRLVEMSQKPQEVPTYDVFAEDDILDETSNPTAQQLATMINKSEQTHHENMVATAQGKIAVGSPPADYWFMNQPDPAAIPAGYTAFASNPTVAPGTTSAPTNQATDTGVDEQKLLDQIHRESTHPNPAYGHMRVLNPLGNPAAASAPAPTAAAPATPPAPVPNPSPTKADPVILRLASNDDLNIATIAREANKETSKPPDDEVVISLR